MRNTPKRKVVEHETVSVKEQALLSDTIRQSLVQMVSSFRQAELLGKQIQLAPTTILTTLELLFQLARKIEALEGVDHEAHDAELKKEIEAAQAAAEGGGNNHQSPRIITLE